MSKKVTISATSSNPPIEYSIWQSGVMLYDWQESNEFVVSETGDFVAKTRDALLGCTDQEAFTIQTPLQNGQLILSKSDLNISGEFKAKIFDDDGLGSFPFEISSIDVNMQEGSLYLDEYSFSFYFEDSFNVNMDILLKYVYENEGDATVKVFDGVALRHQDNQYSGNANIILPFTNGNGNKLVDCSIYPSFPVDDSDVVYSDYTQNYRYDP